MKLKSTVMLIVLLACLSILTANINNKPKELNEISVNSILPLQPHIFVDIDVPWLYKPENCVIHFCRDYYIVNKSDDKCYILNLSGEIINEFQFKTAYFPNPTEAWNYAVVTANSLYGVINRNLEIVIPIEYDYVSDIVDDMVFASNKAFNGYINLRNIKMIPINNSYSNTVNKFSEGVAFIYISGKPSYVINTQGDIIYEVPDGVEECTEFSQGIAAYRFKNDLMTVFINTKGEELFRMTIIPPFAGNGCNGGIYPDKSLPVFEERGIARVNSEESQYNIYIDRNGNRVNEVDYPIIHKYKNDLNPKLNPSIGVSKYGFVNRTGELIIPYQFYFALDYIEGKAFVNKYVNIFENAWAIIDEKGCFVIPFQKGGEARYYHSVIEEQNGSQSLYGIVDVKKLNPAVIINGTPIEFDNYPQLINSKVLIPASGIEDNFYCEVTTDNDNIIIKHQNQVITAKAGSTSYYFNGNQMDFPVAPFFLNGEALIPIDYLKHLMQFSSKWYESERKLEITMK